MTVTSIFLFTVENIQEGAEFTKFESEPEFTISLQVAVVEV